MSEPREYKGQWWLLCETCGRDTVVGYKDVTKVFCSYCVQARMIREFPEDFEEKKKDGIKRPRGWHFMSEFVDKDGTVWHKGEEQPELKGTLKVTKWRVKRKKKKLTLLEQEAKDLKEMEKLAKVYKQKKKRKELKNGRKQGTTKARTTTNRSRKST